MARVLVVGLNPAWQMVMELPRLDPGAVNRARVFREIASGKGLNAARILAQLGHEVHLLQVLGGDRGRRCLAACEAAGIRSLHVRVREETRICATLLDGFPVRATEVISPFAVGPGPKEAEALEREILEAVESSGGGYEGLAVCGTAPSGLPPGLYGRIAERVRTRIFVLDAWREIDMDLLARADFVKVNAQERGTMARALGADPAEAARGVLLVTDGPRPALILRRGRPAEVLRLPETGGVVNPIGAGDAVAAGLMHHALSGKGARGAFAEALALGMASCATPLPADVPWERVPEIRRRMLDLNGMGGEDAA